MSYYRQVIGLVEFQRERGVFTASRPLFVVFSRDEAPSVWRWVGPPQLRVLSLVDDTGADHGDEIVALSSRRTGHYAPMDLRPASAGLSLRGRVVGLGSCSDLSLSAARHRLWQQTMSNGRIVNPN